MGPWVVRLFCRHRATHPFRGALSPLRLVGITAGRPGTFPPSAASIPNQMSLSTPLVNPFNTVSKPAEGFRSAILENRRLYGGSPGSGGRGKAASKPLLVSSGADLKAALEAAKDKSAVVYYTAQWCTPCQAIAPVFEQLSGDFPETRFLKVDIDEEEEELQAMVAEAGVSSIPTFQFFRLGSQVARFSGADANKLQTTVSTLQ
eukprot:TRINITY_DN17071_c0_g1_i1.p1 TRINITY_DN17071_c0_g1~~TRINITY_DN17071_c0_g1_i1.p1  ORF type:complete len:204 (-),score=31.20 TRINITY_DN17071_c0_g1_i1:521-1132(-)